MKANAAATHRANIPAMACPGGATSKGDDRILYVTPGYRLIALDANSGAPIKSFGENGIVDLKKDADQDIDLEKGAIGLHATPLVARNTVMVGAAFLGGSVPAKRGGIKGYVRGFDARTGARRWIFHTVPAQGRVRLRHLAEVGRSRTDRQYRHVGAIRRRSGPQSCLSADRNADRRCHSASIARATDCSARPIVAVDIDSGQRKWHYQTVHHGLWDRDSALRTDPLRHSA